MQDPIYLKLKNKYGAKAHKYSNGLYVVYGKDDSYYISIKYMKADNKYVYNAVILNENSYSVIKASLEDLKHILNSIQYQIKL